MLKAEQQEEAEINGLRTKFDLARRGRASFQGCQTDNSTNETATKFPKMLCETLVFVATLVVVIPDRNQLRMKKIFNSKFMHLAKSARND